MLLSTDRGGHSPGGTRPGARALIKRGVDERRARGVLAGLNRLRSGEGHDSDPPPDRLVQTELRVLRSRMTLPVFDEARAVGAAERGAQRPRIIQDQALRVPLSNFGERGRQEPFQTVGTDEVFNNCPSTAFSFATRGWFLRTSRAVAAADARSTSK